MASLAWKVVALRGGALASGAWSSGLGLAVCLSLAACAAEGVRQQNGSASGSGMADGALPGDQSQPPGEMMGGTDSGGSGGGTIVLDPTTELDLGPVFQLEDPGADGAYRDPDLAEGDAVVNSFDGAPASAGAPALVYPLAGSMHPRNLGLITFQWSPGDAANSLFRIEVTGGTARYHFYVPCTPVLDPMGTTVTGTCIHGMPRSEWLTLGQRFSGQSVELAISATASAGAPVATSAVSAISFSPEPLIGALYYWAAGDGTAAKPSAIKRASFGADKAVPFIVPETDTAGFQCVGCHSVSRNGDVIAFAVAPMHGENIAAIQTAPTENPASPWVEPAAGNTPFSANTANSYDGVSPAPIDHFGHNVALSPDGKVAAVNGIPEGSADHWPPYLELRDTRTGDALVRYPLEYGDTPPFGNQQVGIHPEWSPDGKSLVVALADSLGDTADFGCVWTSETCRSRIAVLPFDGAGLGEAQVVVESAAGYEDSYHFYPTWSPDGQWVAFASATHDSAPGGRTQKSLSNDNAVLRMVRSTGGPYECPGPQCYELTRGMQYSVSDADAGNGKRSTWPKFTPFAQGDDSSLMFVSFNSRIDYGFLSTGETQLWMFAVDVSGLQAGADPSFTPIWLPYQEFDDASLTPYWTTSLPCEVDPDGGCAGCVGDEQCVVNESTNECGCAAVII